MILPDPPSAARQGQSSEILAHGARPSVDPRRLIAPRPWTAFRRNSRRAVDRERRRCFTLPDPGGEWLIVCVRADVGARRKRVVARCRRRGFCSVGQCPFVTPFGRGLRPPERCWTGLPKALPPRRPLNRPSAPRSSPPAPAEVTRTRSPSTLAGQQACPGEAEGVPDALAGARRSPFLLELPADGPRPTWPALAETCCGPRPRPPLAEPAGCSAIPPWPTFPHRSCEVGDHRPISQAWERIHGRHRRLIPANDPRPSTSEDQPRIRAPGIRCGPPAPDIGRLGRCPAAGLPRQARGTAILWYPSTAPDAPARRFSLGRVARCAPRLTRGALLVPTFASRGRRVIGIPSRPDDTFAPKSASPTYRRCRIWAKWCGPGRIIGPGSRRSPPRWAAGQIAKKVSSGRDRTRPRTWASGHSRLFIFTNGEVVFEPRRGRARRRRKLGIDGTRF